ncbi:MAG TPA: VWA domain-containing protein [Candidatus Acidoferrales bacterium]|nr:VWA domain-containing protein [Candidatus Acidoferrales bacterium]
MSHDKVSVAWGDEVTVRCVILPPFVLCLAAVLAASQATHPALVPAQPAAGHRILLDVVVTDKSGKPISGLQEQDFTILDDKTPAKITSFHASEPTEPSDPPVQAIILVDGVNASIQSVIFETQQLQKFLRQNNGQLPLPMSLAIFSDASQQMQPESTRDGNVLADGLGANQPGLRSLRRSAGFWGASERLQLSLQTLERITRYEEGRPGRKLLLWISPGWPLLSGPSIQLTNRDERMLFNSVVDFSRQLRDARVTLYSIDPLGTGDAGSFRAFYYQSFLKGVPNARKVDSGNLALQVLATQSGGMVLNSSNDLQKLLAAPLGDAKAFYTLSFDAPPADHPDEYHALQVKVDKPGLSARTRTGYYAQPYPTTVH